MPDLPEVTLILGPQTGVSLALNVHLRENRNGLRSHGITVMPSRFASPLMRRVVDQRPEAERLAEFKAKAMPRPVILSAVELLGRPQAGLAKGELFPDAELALAGMATIIRDARVVFAIDPLPSFFLAAGSDLLEERVRTTPWEVLYELNWYEMLTELVDLLPDATFLVLTGRGVAKEPQQTLARLLGDDLTDLPAPYSMLRQLISETGHAVLDRMLERGPPDAEMLADLCKSFSLTPAKEDIRDRLGLDKVTNILLEQRFEEDLEQIATLPRVELIR